jgi:predicted tellurium resistance membrane protein TerC
VDWIAPLLTLTAMEVVLGIDNIVFLSILVAGLPTERRDAARRLGLVLALVARIVLLLGVRWVMSLDKPVFHWSSIGFVPDIWVQNHHVDSVTGRDLVLLAGGLFLVGKSVKEIHNKAEGEDDAPDTSKKRSFAGVLAQIVVIDLVFSLDSVISAVGMVDEIWVMVVAMLVAVGFMALFAGKVSAFIEANPTFKMLALAFLILIGVMLFAEGIGTHIPKGYIYSAMVFALAVEALNMRTRKKPKAPEPDAGATAK